MVVDHTLPTPNTSSHREFMNRISKPSMVASGLLLLVLMLLPACNREPGTDQQLSEMEKSFANPPATASAKSEPATGADSSPQTADAPTLVKKALTAVRSDQPAEGIMMLQTAQKLPNLNADQRMSVHNSIRAVTADLVNRAARGDERAKAELKRIEAFLGQN